jgi:hypothetical protein
VKVQKYGALYPRATRALSVPPRFEAALHEPTCQVLIVSYQPDFYWLAHCLASLRKFSVGFLPPVVCVPDWNETECRKITHHTYPEARVVTRSFLPGHEKARSQIAFMMADLYCPDAQFIFKIDSDCIATAEFRPDPYFSAGKPVMWYASYDALYAAWPGPGSSPHRKWQTGTERILGFAAYNEYTCRVPYVYPREVFPALRGRVEDVHRKSFVSCLTDFDAAHHDVSDCNLLGAYAHRLMPDVHEWVDTSEGRRAIADREWKNCIGWFWSWGGLDAVGCPNSYIPGRDLTNRTPRQIIKEIVG